MIFYLALAVGGVYLYSKTSGASVKKTDIKNLPDVLPDLDKSGFPKTFDPYFSSAASDWDIPYALMKAHAKRESNFDPGAYHYDNASRGGSHGVMQVEYLKGTDMYSKLGYPDSQLVDGTPLYDLNINTQIAAQIIAGNLSRFSSLRDAINAYNTGVGEGIRKAPNNYVNDVLANYSKIVGYQVS